MGGGSTLRKHGRAAPVGEPPGGPPVFAVRPPLGPGRVRLLLAALVLVLALAAVQQLVTVTALPGIVGELHGGDRMAWTVTAYLGAAAATPPLFGRLGDVLGRKGVLQCAVVVFLAGSALAAGARTMDQLIVFRAVQGAGAGGLLTGALSVLADLAPGRARGRRLGVVGAALGLGAVAGPLLGGLTADGPSWRWCFAAPVPLGLLSLTVISAVLEPSPPVRPPRPALLGALLLAAASAGTVLLASWGGARHAWDSAAVLALAAGTGAAVVAFLAVERLSPDPSLPPRFPRERVVAVVGPAGIAVTAVLLAVAVWLPLRLRLVHGADAVGAAVLTTPLMVALAVASVLSGTLAGRPGRPARLPVAGTALCAAGLWLLARPGAGAYRPGQGLGPALLDAGAGQALLGAGIGLTLPALLFAVQNSAPPARPASVAGVHDCVRTTGGTAVAAAVGAFFASRLTTALAEGLPAGATPPEASAAHSVTARSLLALPPAVRAAYGEAYATVAPQVLLWLLPLLAAGLIAACFLKDRSTAFHPVPVPGPEDVTIRLPRPRTAPAAPPSPAVGSPSSVAVGGIVRHHDGAVVPSAALTLVDAQGQQIGRGASDESGRYALTAPGAGSYVMIAAADGHQPQAVAVTVQDRPVVLDVVLGGAGRLVGAVVTADGRPVPDAIVTLTDAHGEVVAAAAGGPEGEYAMPELVAGEYTLAASAPAFRPAALPVEVRPARDTRRNIELAGGAALRGTVRAGGGRPVDEARVTLLDAAGHVVDTLTTGPDGAFRFLDLPTGEYTVIAAGYPPLATVLRVADGAGAEHDLRLGHDR